MSSAPLWKRQNRPRSFAYQIDLGSYDKITII